MKEKLINFAIEHIKSNKHKLADEFQHLFYTSIYDEEDQFPVLSIFVDEEGRGFETLTPDLPSKVMCNLYPVSNFYIEELSEKYKKLNENYGVKCKISCSSGIVQSPFKISAYTVEGDERLIKKLEFNEKLKGEYYLRLSKLISKEKLDFIIKNYKKWNNEIFYFPHMNYIHIVYKLKEDIPLNKRGISIEIAKLLKEKMFEKYPHIETSYKLPEMKIKETVLTVFKIKSDKIDIYDFNKFYETFNKKIKDIITQIAKFEV